MVKRRDVVRFFTKRGFVNMGGARHDKFVHPDGLWTMIERHGEIDDAMFQLLKRQAGIDESKGGR